MTTKFIFFASMFFLGNAVLGQQKELSIIVQPSLYFSVMGEATDGKFKRNNPEVGYIHWGVRYKQDKNSIAIAYTSFPIEMDLIAPEWRVRSNTNGRRFTSIPLYIGHEVTTLFRGTLAIDLQLGNYFILGNFLGLGGGSADSFNTILNSNATWAFQRYYNRKFSVLPFFGVELRNVRVKKIDFCFGYRRLIGVQQLGITHIQYREPNEPVKHYTLENKGCGNVLFLSTSIRLWRKIKEPKMITSPFDYPTRISNK